MTVRAPVVPEARGAFGGRGAARKPSARRRLRSDDELGDEVGARPEFSSP